MLLRVIVKKTLRPLLCWEFFFERIPCKSLIACSVSRLPEQNESWSFSIASDLKGSWGRFQRKIGFLSKTTRKSYRKTHCNFARGWLVGIYFRSSSASGETLWWGCLKSCLIPPAAAQEGAASLAPAPGMQITGSPSFSPTLQRTKENGSSGSINRPLLCRAPAPTSDTHWSRRLREHRLF